MRAIRGLPVMMVRLTIILNKSWGHAGYQGTSCDDGKTHHYPEQVMGIRGLPAGYQGTSDDGKTHHYPEQARGHAGYQGTSCDDGKTHHYPEQAMGTCGLSGDFL